MANADKDLRERSVERFNIERPIYEGFCGEIERLLRVLLAQTEISIINVESRTKSVESFREKVFRDGKDYRDPLVDITDLVGCRIICYYPSDVDKIEHIVRNNFKVDEKNTPSASERVENPREFGYKSRHLIVLPSDARAALPEFRRFANLKAEV
jgi:ppGpp synthetase/RelA/SpoT-type nucleotidyltranferase